MTDKSPRLAAALAALSVFVLAYSVVIAGQLFLGLQFVVAVAVVYLGYRFLLAFERLADALRRLADAREREAGESRL